ncbi:MAG: flagellar motor switch protein FliG, partial [Treponema sp.]|nr:flagellar motor switch protein FliG [Treponema sp.]
MKEEPVQDRNGLLKTPEETKCPLPPENREGDSKYRRVAKFLILIGAEKAAGILSRLDEDQVEAVSREIAGIRAIPAEEGEGILREFRNLFSASYPHGGLSSGGVGEARRLLYAAFGPEKGEGILNRSVPSSRESPFGFLEELKPEQLALLLKNEAAPASALVLSRLSPKFAARVLANTPPERKLDIIRRIARMGESPPEVLERVAGALREKARAFADPGAETQELDGMKALADILKQGDYAFGDRILEELEGEDPDLGRNLKERLYTLEDVIRAEDKPLQEKLRAMTDRDIALLLKGKEPGFTGKILSNLSAQR